MGYNFATVCTTTTTPGTRQQQLQKMPMDEDDTLTLTNEDYAFGNINEPYGQQRHLGSPTMQAWILIQEMEALQVIWERQEPLSLPPEKWLKVLKEIRDRLQKTVDADTTKDASTRTPKVTNETGTTRCADKRSAVPVTTKKQQEGIGTKAEAREDAKIAEANHP